MSTLYVVRHGQASFFEADYDRLSPLGERQSCLLGEYWAARRLVFHRVYTGPRVRQIETARFVGECYQQAGLPWPDPIVHAGFDEYEAEAVLKTALPVLLEEHDEIRRLNEAVMAAQSKGREEQLRTFQKMYEVIIGMWSRAELTLDGVESWADFARRARGALDDVTSGGTGGEQVVAFTSGGPVGVALERALQTSTERTLQAAWMVRNGSFSEYLFSKDRFTLSSFNAYPHLDSPELLTYR